MVKLELSARETYLTFLSVRDRTTAIMQYPDPEHEQLKAEFNALLMVWSEALEAAASTAAAGEPPQEKPKSKAKP